MREMTKEQIVLQKRAGENMNCLLYTSEYSFYHYSQLGDYKCPSCGFARPEIKYDAHDVKVGDQLSFQVEDKHLTANYLSLIHI